MYSLRISLDIYFTYMERFFTIFGQCINVLNYKTTDTDEIHRSSFISLRTINFAGGGDVMQDGGHFGCYLKELRHGLCILTNLH